MRIVMVAVAVLVGAAVGRADAADRTPLFNGSDLTGWSALGEATWSVADGVIVGRCKPTQSGWLVADGDYADFVLEVEFQSTDVDAGMRLRTHIIDGQPYEGDPLFPIGEAARRAFRPGEWNRIEARMIGDHLTVLLNGATAVDVDYDQAVHGAIALDVRAGAKPGEARWRKVTIRNLGWGEGWTPLFNGRDLTGWVEHGEESWEAVDGELVGRAVTKKYGYLATEQTYRDFEVRIEFQCIGDGNSGLFFHSTLEGVNIRGVQSEISAGHKQNTAGVYESGGRGWLVRPTEAGDKVYRPGEWNTMRVRCQGNRTTTWLNGFQVVDLVDPKQRYSDGVIALQLHSGGNAGVKWREIHIRDVAAP